MALDVEDIEVDLHCVTRWSKLATRWRGVPVEALLEDVESAGDYVMAHSYGGYTTNLPLEDLLDGKAWVAFEYDDGPLPAEHGGRRLRCHTCTCEVGEMAERFTLMTATSGFLGRLRLPQLRRPVERGTLRR